MPGSGRVWGTSAVVRRSGSSVVGMAAPETSDPVVRVLRVVAPLVAVAFGVLVAIGLASGTFTTEGEQILALGWGRITLVDVYLAFALAVLWVFLRESVGRAVALTVGIVVLGSVVIWAWVGWAAWTSSTRRELVMGPRA